jgi:hypothetical protein
VIIGERIGSRVAALYLFVSSIVLATPVLAQDGTTIEAILERLDRLEQTQREQKAEIEARDRRIAELEAQLGLDSNVGAEPPPAAAIAESGQGAEVADFEPEYFGEFHRGGRGFKLASSSLGDVNFSAWTYARYLNQKGLDDTYTDAFGRTRELDLRHDVQLQKIMLYFKGWMFDPKLRYMTYLWTSNTSQGLPAQVVIGGNLTYNFNEGLTAGVGIGGLPSTRSVEGNSPNWLRVDNRTLADEFFRASFTTGIFANGKISDTLRYQAMLGNNLSQLGVDAAQLGDSLDTFAGALVWTPHGQFFNGFGDFEQSETLRTRFGFHYTHSTEDRQSQPGTEDPENSIIRLSDGTPLFSPNAFNTGGRVNEARYQMVAVDAAAKLDGWALEGEYYFRQVDNFVTEGVVPVDDLWDHGFQLQASTMLVPQTWQLYLTGSKVFGEYGDPWDISLGVNWFPYKSRQVRINGELLHLSDSPVGNLSLPSIVGGNGTVFYANAELRF